MENPTDTERDNEKSYDSGRQEVQSQPEARKIPETRQNPKHIPATASIFIDGLSVLCPSRNGDAVEIAFLEDEHTPVHIEIRDKNGKVVGEPYDCPEGQKVKIEIQKSNPKEMGKVYKKGKQDDDDFEWMPDLNGPDWHPRATIGIKPNAKNYLSAKLVLKDAVFYTQRKSRCTGTQENLETGETKELTLGRFLGANIVCERADEGIIVRTSSGFNPPVLKKEDGPFSIYVLTRTTYEHDHLHHLYDHILTLSDNHRGYRYQYHCRESPLLSELASGENGGAPYNDSSEEANKTADTNDVGIRSIEYACQTFPGGNGPLPDLP